MQDGKREDEEKGRWKSREDEEKICPTNLGIYQLKSQGFLLFNEDTLAKRK